MTKIPNFVDVCNKGNLRDIRIFLKLGNDLQYVVNNNGLNALQIACMNNNVEIAQLLIDHNFDINVKHNGDNLCNYYPNDESYNKNNCFTLFDLSFSPQYPNLDIFVTEKSKCAKLLIENGFKLHKDNIYYIIVTDDADVLELWINEYGIENLGNNLDEAVEVNSIECVKRIFSLIDCTSHNLLHVAFRTLKEQIKTDKGIFQCDDYNASMEMIEFLMTKINITSQDNSGETPFDMMMDKDIYFKFVKLVEKYESISREFKLWERFDFYDKIKKGNNIGELIKKERKVNHEKINALNECIESLELKIDELIDLYDIDKKRMDKEEQIKKDATFVIANARGKKTTLNSSDVIDMKILNESLNEAVKNHQIENIKQLIDKGTLTNKSNFGKLFDDDIYTIDEMLSLAELIFNNLDEESRDDIHKGYILMYDLCGDDDEHYKIIKLLFNKTDFFQICNVVDLSELVAKRRNYKIAQFLINKKLLDLNVALKCAVLEKDKKMIELLLENGAPYSIIKNADPSIKLNIVGL